MQYDGKYNVFDPDQISTYPLGTRSNKVELNDLVRPMDLENITIDLPENTCSDIETIAEAVVSSRKAEKPVVLFTG